MRVTTHLKVVLITSTVFSFQPVSAQELLDLKANKPSLTTSKAAVQAGGNRILLTDVQVEGKGLYDVELAFNSAQGTFVVANARAKRVLGEFSCLVRQPNFSLQVTHSKTSPIVNLRFTAPETFTSNPSNYALIQKRRKMEISNNVQGQGKASDSAAVGSLARKEYKVQFVSDFYVQPGVDVDLLLTDVPGWFDFSAPLEGISMSAGFQAKTFKCE
jgi:hypothetical protein